MHRAHGRVYVYANSYQATGLPETPPPGLSFLGPRPNPASSEVHLDFALDQAAWVRVTVYDLAGHEVARPIGPEWLSGRVDRTWRPGTLPGGIYYMRAQIGDRSEVRRLIWLGH